MSEYNKYLNVVLGTCVSTFDETKVVVGEKYRLGIRYNPILQKEAYYLLDVKSVLGIPIYVDPDRGYFEEEEHNSVSFIMT